MDKYYLSRPFPFHNLKIEAIEKMYGATWLGPWELEEYGDEPLEIFYIPKPMEVSGRLAERYVGLYVQDSYLYSAAVDDVFNRVLVGVVAKDGELCISRFSGDHYISQDATTWVDGGPGMIATNRPENLVRLYAVDNWFEVESVGLIDIEPSPVTFAKSIFSLFK